MKLPNKFKLFLITLSLCCAAPLAAETKAEAEPAPWHVENAELRAPVKVDVKGALLRMPPQVYVAGLKPLETTNGIAFDPQTKAAIQIDIRNPKEKAATIGKLKENYKTTPENHKTTPISPPSNLRQPSSLTHSSLTELRRASRATKVKRLRPAGRDGPTAVSGTSC